MTDKAGPSPARAALWMACALSCFSLMAVSGREAGRVMPTADLLVWRSVIGALVVCAILPFSVRGFGQIRTARVPQHLGRNLFHFFGQYCWYYAVTLIPLAQLFALEFTSPIWVALFAPLFLGERFTFWKAVAVVMGFAGVLLVVRPINLSTGISLGHGQLWALMSAIGFAGNMIATKRLSASETSLCIVFYMTVMQAPMGMVLSGGLPMIPPDVQIGFWTLALGLAGLSAHFCLAQAFRHADATIVVPMDFVRLPLIAAVGMLAYGERLDLFVFAGGALIFLGNYLNIRAQAAKARSLVAGAQPGS
jgi:drug/metabolite transporter (DMT)-like permease